RDLRLGRGVVALRPAQRLCRRRLSRFHVGNFVLQRCGSRLGGAYRLLQLGEARFQSGQGAAVGLGERLQLAFQALAALLERLPAALEVSEVRLLELEAAL